MTDPKTDVMEIAIAIDPVALTLTERNLRSWLASDALRGPDGAYHAWLDLNSRKRSFPYPEITGYALTYLVGRQTSRHEIRAAHQAATWLTQRLERGNYAARDEWDNGAVYAFDLAMIATGLLNLGRLDGMACHLVSGLTLARSLAEHVDADGDLPPVIATPEANTDRPASWSTVGRPHMAKTVQCLLLAAEHGDAVCEQAASRLIRRTMARQEPDGRFITQDDPSYTMLHPHMYTTEALWMWAMARDDRVALDHARAALDWAWAQQLPSGGFPRSVVASATDGGCHPDVEQMDATAQAIRMALLLRPNSPRVSDGCARLVDVAESVEHGSALPYQPASGQRHMNAWVSMFASQTLNLAVEGPAVMEWRFLV